MNFTAQNILVIDFGQLGDVILSLPALDAIRKRFPAARITVAVGKSCAIVVDLSNCADEKIVVDRVALRDGARLRSIFQISRLVADVRRRKFDLVIDLHSLSETNILGFLSGAPARLFARRENRSLEFLANFRPAPPREDRTKHATDRYLDVLKPLGIEDAKRTFRLDPPKKDLEFINKLWHKHKINSLAVGLFPGAGHPSRRWSLDKFAELADFLSRNEKVQVIVFLGPEELELAAHIRQIFPKNTIVFDNLTLTELIAAQSRLSLFVSNDTGPMHLAAATGTSVLLLMDEGAPQTYTPLIENLRVVRNGKIEEITVDAAYRQAQELLRTERVSKLFN